jgi:hypothetical protein
VTEEDGRVVRWEDQSGNGFLAEQPVAEARPEIDVAALNGQPALRFDGKGRFLSIPKQVLTSQQFTVIAVASDRTDGTASRQILSNWRRDANVGTSVFLGLTGPGAVRLSDAFSPAGILEGPARPFVLTAVSELEGPAVYQNRRALAARAVALPPRNLLPPYVIGQQGNINGEFWNGEIAEILVYDRALSERERSQVWDWLGRRYGIAPPPAPQLAALRSLCRVLLNTNEFVYVD